MAGVKEVREVQGGVVSEPVWVAGADLVSDIVVAAGEGYIRAAVVELTGPGDVAQGEIGGTEGRSSSGMGRHAECLCWGGADNGSKAECEEGKSNHCDIESDVDDVDSCNRRL